MNPSYKKEKDNDYMILEAPGRPDGSEYQIRMLLLNQMEGILPCKMRKIDGIPEFFYDITCRQPMPRAFERRQMKKEDIEALLNGLERALDESGRYLLDMKQFVLKPEYIFREVESGTFIFCYLPFYEGSLEEDFRELAEYILKRLDHNQEEAVLWGYDIYSRVMEENFSIGKILASAKERTGREMARQAAENTEEPEIEMVETEDDEEETRPEPEYCVKEEGKPEKPPQKNLQKPEVRPVKVKNPSKCDLKKPVQFIIGVGLIIGITVWAVVSQGLNLVQAAGILFLGIGGWVWFLSVFQKKPVGKEDPLEEIVEEWESLLKEEPIKEKAPMLTNIESDRQEAIMPDKVE